MLRVGLTNQLNTMVGAKATNALSSQFTVVSARDGKKATAEFKKGELISYKEEPVISIGTGVIDKNISGTTVSFIPDETIFKEGIRLDYTALRKQIQELAYLSPGMRFIFRYEDKEEEVMFIHIREAEEIDKVKQYVKIPCITLLVTRSQKKNQCWGNPSDDNVALYQYDYRYNNDKPLKDAKRDFPLFLQSIFETETAMSKVK